MLNFRIGNNDIYKDIRPFSDDEIENALKYLKRNPLFLHFLRKGFTSVFDDNAKEKINEAFSAKTVSDIEKVTYSGIEKILSSSSFTVKGLERINPEQNYIYMSNHRFIIKDPLFINYALQRNNIPTAIIGIGNNLTKLKQLEYVVRMNKCFLVKRDKNNAYKNIRHQMHFVHDVLSNKHSIWIAQSKGRSKDNTDLTDKNILKMLYKEFNADGYLLNDFLEQNPIIPVSLSYEKDPCILDKAQVLYDIEKYGEHKKTKFEDLKTMWHELHNSTGSVSINFDEPITSVSNIDELRLRIDHSIHSNYELFSLNRGAYDSLDPNIDTINLTWLSQFHETPDHLLKYVTQLYSNPSINYEKATQ